MSSYETPLLMPLCVKQRLLALNLRPRTVLDIGAYDGYWSKDIKSIFPECQPFMIEGNKDKQTVLENCGFPYEISLLSDCIKNVDYYKIKPEVSQYTTGNSIYREDSEYFTPDNCIVEPTYTKTLKDVVARNNITDIDLIKLDVQGSEKDVMMGGLDIIRNCKAIFIELPIMIFNIGSPGFVEMINFMDQIGFYLSDIVDLRYVPVAHPNLPPLTQIDAIFLNKNKLL